MWWPSSFANFGPDIAVGCGDVRTMLASIPDGTVQCCVTSPPYWGLRDYGVEGQIGMEPTPDAYVQTMVEVFREVRRVLHDSGTVWLNVGDSYHGSWGNSGSRPELDGKTLNQRPKEADYIPRGGWDERRERPPSSYKIDGLKPKDLCLIPWRLAIALQQDGWWVRSVICWAKKSCMPESVTDRPTNSWEPIFLLAKSAKYFYDAEAVKEKADSEPHVMGNVASKDAGHLRNDLGTDAVARVIGNGTRNQRNVWHLGPDPYAEAHFATFPTEIPRRAILAGTSARGCCPTCLAPWVRVVDRVGVPRDRNCTDGKDDNPGRVGSGRSGKNDLSGAKLRDFKAENPDRTVGWKSGCKCGERPIPCVVLDPFAGAGTSLLVAHELRRRSLGIELNPEYVGLIGRRLDPAIRDRASELPFPDDYSDCIDDETNPVA